MSEMTKATKVEPKVTKSDPLVRLPQGSCCCPSCGIAVEADEAEVEWVQSAAWDAPAGQSLPLPPIPTSRCPKCRSFADVAREVVASHAEVLKARYESAAQHRVETMLVALSQVDSGWRRRATQAEAYELLQLIGLFSQVGSRLRFVSLLVPTLQVGSGSCSRRPWSHWRLGGDFADALEGVRDGYVKLLAQAVNGAPQPRVVGVPATPASERGRVINGAALVVIEGGCLCCGVSKVMVPAGRDIEITGPPRRGVTVIGGLSSDPESWLDRNHRAGREWQQNRQAVLRRGDDPDATVQVKSLPPRQEPDTATWRWRETGTSQLGVSGRQRRVGGWACNACNQSLSEYGLNASGIETALMRHLGKRSWSADLDDRVDGSIAWGADYVIAKLMGGAMPAPNAVRFGHLGSADDLRAALDGRS